MPPASSEQIASRHHLPRILMFPHRRGVAPPMPWAVCDLPDVRAGISHRMQNRSRPVVCWHRCRFWSVEPIQVVT